MKTKDKEVVISKGSMVHLPSTYNWHHKLTMYGIKNSYDQVIMVDRSKKTITIFPSHIEKMGWTLETL